MEPQQENMQMASYYCNKMMIMLVSADKAEKQMLNKQETVYSNSQKVDKTRLKKNKMN